MRLTLRNLMRFLDQASLGSMERQRLVDLVEQSDRASAWIERIKRLRSDARKSAPAVGGPPAASEVARYLDGSMSEQEIVEFEESMLACDELLAEVASAHLIAQRIHAAEPPAVPVVLRQTLYDLDRVFAVAAGSTQRDEKLPEELDAVTAMQDLPFVDAEPVDAPNPYVPDGSDTPGAVQLPPVSLENMQRKAKGRSWIVAVLTLALLGGAFGLTYWLGRISARPTRLAGEPDRDSTGKAPALRVDEEPTKLVVDDEEPRNPDAIPASGESIDDRKISEVPSSTGEASADSETDRTDINGPETEVDQSLVYDQPQPPVDKGNSPDEAGDTIPVRPDISAPVSTPLVFLGPELPPLVIARAATAQPLVLITAPGEDQWTTLVAPRNLHEGTRVQVLAGYTAEFEFGELLKLSAKGPAVFSLGKRDRASKADVLEIEFGNFSVVSAEGDVDWIMQSGSHRYRITMTLANAAVHVHLTGYLPPGIDPRTVSPAMIWSFRSTAGRCRIQQDKQVWNLSENMAVVQSESDDPRWSTDWVVGILKDETADPRYVGRLSAIVDNNLRDWVSDRTDMLTGLVDLKVDTRQEIRLAAMAWLAEQGNFDYVIDYLVNTANKSNWRTFVEALRQTVYNQPALANNLFDSLVFAGADKQQQLFDLILGMSPEELAAGGDARLVEYLNDEYLGIRVLAIENLRDITDGITYGFVPNNNRTQRNRIVKRQWEPKLKKGEIRYSEPLSMPLPKLSPLPSDPSGSGLDILENSGQN